MEVRSTMGKTDNTRPLELQNIDLKVPGWVQHDHSPTQPCDYMPYDLHSFTLNKNYREAWQYERNCQRKVFHFGGENSDCGQPQERRLRKRKYRRRVARELCRIAQLGHTEDFDLLPIRDDRRPLRQD